jgi:hypothetical protein
VAKAESVPPPTVEDIFAHTFKDLPPQLREQLAELKKSQREESS